MKNKIRELAGKIISYSRDRLVAALPLMSHALLRMPVEFTENEFSDGSLRKCGTDAQKIYWDPEEVLRLFKEQSDGIDRCILHMVLHCIYTHMYAYDRMDAGLWDLSADIAVEHVISRMGIFDRLKEAPEKEEVTELLLPLVPQMTAEKIYLLLKENEEVRKQVCESAAAFCYDVHSFWKTRTYEKPAGDLTIYTKAAEFFDEKRPWQQIYRTLSLLKEERSLYEGSLPGAQQVFLGNLSPAISDYARILKKFAVLEEETQLDPESFDQVYYTYGLSLYGNLPLIEPLEYRESFKIRELVIAIDTSGSCQGEKVRAFLRNTCAILTRQQSFFDRFNVHILQCDSQVQKEDVITSKEEFEQYMCDMEIQGAGGTDFRPVFTKVNEMTDRGVFHSLQGLIYFTDGLGSYPEEAPSYKTLFIYPDEKERRNQTPDWAESYTLRKEEW